MLLAWTKFCNAVKHKTRYLFLKAGNNLDIDWEPTIAPDQFLNKLQTTSTIVLTKTRSFRTLIRQLKSFGSEWMIKKFCSVSELATVPQENAIYSNRMSPAGIPMFYGAFDQETAICETIDPSNQKHWASIRTFCSVRSLRLLNLGSLPDIPSVFDDAMRPLIRPLRFFRGFATDIAKRIERDHREHIEYVPTQIVTEFFRHIYKTRDGEKLDGIIYKNSRSDGKSACVIFCDQSQCAAIHELLKKNHILKLTSVEHRSRLARYMPSISQETET